MPTRLSTLLKVSRSDLGRKGIYDATIDLDSRVHIDPALLGKSSIPEFKNADQKVRNFFATTLRLLTLSKTKNDALWRAAFKGIKFGEGLNTGLGYSQKGTSGSGIGKSIANRILDTAKEIIDAGIKDPEIFELVPVLEEGIGPDRISDMISKILSEEFQAYTKRIAGELKTKIPKDAKGKQFVFVPKVFLSDLPIVEQWDDVQIAAAYNSVVRGSLNKLIGKTWKEVASELTKRELKDLLLKNPELIKELIKNYRSKFAKSYDFVLDHFGLLLWDVLGEKYSAEHPLDLNQYRRITPATISKVVQAICEQFRHLMENTGLVDHLYDSNGERRPERFPQLLLYAIADSYCKANDLDLNREVNNGPGALDFKISRGQAKVSIEIKYSSNRKLVEGYEKQLTAYNKADNIPGSNSIYMVLRVNSKQDKKIKEIQNMINERTRRGEMSPALFLINAIKLPSASKR